MWNMLVLTAMISLVGVYTIRNFETFAATDAGVAMSIADSMALYREAVADYFTQNDVLDTSVSFSALKSSHMLPAWSVLYQQSAAPIWNNYRDATGVIYIYASSLPPVNIAAAIAMKSQNSVLNGVYQSGVATLQSPVFGDTRIPVTALNGKSVPDGAPVWIAMPK